MTTIRRILIASSALLAALAAAGCPTTPQPVGPDAGTTDGGGGPEVTEAAREGFKEAVAQFMDIRRASQGWTAAQCDEVAGLFQEVSEDSSSGVAEAIFARGIVFQNCNQHDKAREAFQQALEARPDYPAALVQLGVYAMLDDNDAQAEQYFRRAYGADISAYQAYINLGILAAARGNFRPGQQAAEGAADIQIGSALAIQADAVVALENLARFFFDYSQLSDANSKFRRFAQLVCQYAILKNNQYAPTYNLRGLIYLAEENIRAAISDFQKARTLDPDFFEAHMNYASLNLGFRGYAQAREAYEQALRVRPDSYDAIIGLGVALRGLAQEQEAAQFDENAPPIQGPGYTFQMAQEKYDQARTLDPNRPESYVNSALLLHGFTANLNSSAAYDPVIAAYEEALRRLDNVPANDSGIDYAEVRTLISERIEQCRKDKRTQEQLEEATRMQAQADAAMAQAEEAMRQLEAQQAAEAAAQGGGTPAPEGGGTPAPEGGGTPAPEGGGAAPVEGGAATP